MDILCKYFRIFVFWNNFDLKKKEKSIILSIFITYKGSLKLKMSHPTFIMFLCICDVYGSVTFNYKCYVLYFHCHVFPSLTDCKILSAKSSGPSSILVKWEPYTGATNYFLDLRVINNTNIAPIVVTLSAASTEKDVRALRPGTDYSVTLKVFQFYYVVCVAKDVALTGKEKDS